MRRRSPKLVRAGVCPLAWTCSTRRPTGGPTGAGWTLYPPQAILGNTPGHQWGIIVMLVSLMLFIIGFTMGGLNYVVTVLQGLKLIEFDSLGGSGSRGYGKIRFTGLCIDGQDQQARFDAVQAFPAPAPAP